MLPKVTREDLLELLRRMLLIRHFEEALIGLYNKGHFRGHYHVYIGQEATGVPAISCVGERDYLFTTHRNHGHLLARGADPGRLLAEILGRRDGYNKGKGGSFHTAVAPLGFPHTSAVVAGIIPLATGAAYAARAKKTGQIAVCLFGDGALEEGAAVEAFNLASLLKLPVLYLCENNGKYGPGRAVGVAQSSTMAVYPLTDLAAAYKIPAQQVDGTDAGRVHAVIFEALEKIRRGEGPQFIEAQTVRWPGSATNWPVVPIPTDVALAWDVASVPEAVRDWYRQSDPVLMFARELVEERKATKEEMATIHKSVLSVVADAAKFALASPLPEPEEALKDIFA
ncbi:MAG: pyruvate dehydrogenase (acetyl-transferring) E1 component subunit alpha [Deltaproteobacteria bacterium]|nr:pyruvate dehydrogenase (acetyl-transferring) E1 component subunit alpha [Deltaproteobacteria bacterium]